MSSYNTRWIVKMPTEFASEIDFMDSKIRVIGKLSQMPLLLLIENTVSNKEDIENAFYASWERINLFCIACTYIGYGEAVMLSHIATLPSDYNEVPEFEVLVQQVINEEKKKYVINQNDISKLEEAIEGNYSNAFICVASALRASSIEEKTVLMHSGCQEMAVVSGVEKIIQRCPACGTENDTGRPATNNYTRKIFIEGVENGKDIYNNFSTLRNKIGHGKPLKTLNEHMKARFDIASSQGVVTAHLDKCLEFNRNAGTQAITGQPFSIYDFKRINDLYNITPKRFAGLAATSKVSQEEVYPQEEYEMNYGISFNIERIFNDETMPLIFGA